MLAIRKMLVQSADDVREAMRVASEGTDADIMELAKKIARHEMIQGKAAQATAEWGRAGRSFRMLMEGSAEAEDLNAFLKENTGRDLFQLREMAELGAKLRTPRQVSQFVADTSFGKVRSAIVYYYINALISGPVTHLPYSVGNAINAIVSPLVTTPVAATIGSTRAMFGLGDAANRVYWGEVGAELYGLMKGTRDAWSPAAEAFRTGQSPPLPGERATATPFGGGAAVSPIPGPIGTALGVPGRSVAFIHSFFKQIRYEQQIQRLAVRIASSEGLDGDLYTSRIGDLTQHPTDDMMASATAESLKELYMSPTEYNSLVGTLTRYTNKYTLSKVMLPFVKIGAQIDRNAFVEYSPLGVASSRIRTAIMSGTDDTDIQLAKMTVGIGAASAMVGMTLEGLATGDGPSEPARRAEWLLNHKPNHITIGPVSIPYQGLGYFGVLMRLAANMTENISGMNEADSDFHAAHIMEGITRAILDDGFVRNFKDIIDAAHHPQEYGTQFLRNFATNWLPYSVGMGQVARLIDPVQREQSHEVLAGLGDAFKARIPFLSETLKPRYDRFGVPMPSYTGLPGLISHYANDPTVLELDRLHLGIGRTPRELEGAALTNEQHDELDRLAGTTIKQMLDKTVASPTYKRAPLHSKRNCSKQTLPMVGSWPRTRF